MKQNDKVVTFSVAPAVRVALGEEFGMKIGTNIDKKMVGALKKIGANYVFDVTFSADLTIMEEAMELVNRIKQNKNLPLFTSCCPAWVKYAELFYPELLSNISTCKSPISMQGTIIKTYFAKKVNIDHNNIVNVVVAPCTAKKAEIKRKELSITNQDNDYVITTRELAKLLKEHNINLEECKEEEFDSPLGDGSGAGVIFGNTGGVTEAAFRTAYYYITGKDLKDDELVFSEVRGMNGIKNIEVNIDGINIKGAVVNGMKNLKKVLDIIKEDSSSYQFIEVMNCNGGCIAGGRNYFHINSAGDAEPCVFIHYSSANIKEVSVLDALRQPLFMAYHNNQPFNNNHLRPCPMLENPEKLQQMVHETGAKSTDLQSPETVEHLCGKCEHYAKECKTKADELWGER